ncbi:MAG: 4Fe-4S dicluster domain-containing protein [Proteobacteria bacterium]|nr:4Fe-4S dicluster domain-containing protein [Pseudomonadota bacterium]
MRSADDCPIAVFVDHCDGTLSHVFDEEMIRYIAGLPQVVSCYQDENLLHPGRLEKLMAKVRKGRADRVVIVGRSPKVYEESFRRLGTRTELDPYMFLVANVREQGAWMVSDEAVAREKIREVVARKVKEAKFLTPIGHEKVAVPKRAVILGGGVVGMRTALALANANIDVTLLTRAKDIGGKAVQLTHFYDRPGEVSAWFRDQIKEVKKHKNITVKGSVELKGLDGCLGDYRIKIQDASGKKGIVKGSAVVLAMGNDVIPNTEGIFGHERFIAPPQIEAMLKDEGTSLKDKKRKPIRTVTFVLDLVNESIKIDSANAVKNAILLRRDYGTTVYVICRDVKVSLDGMEKQYRKAREMGVIFIKYDDPPRFSLVDSQVNIEVKEASTQLKGDEYSLSILSDLVVVSERFVPSPDNEMLADIIGLPRPEEGFLMDDNPQFAWVRTNRRGIYIAGGCRYPQTLDEALIEATAAAAEVTELLSTGTYEYDLAVAEIDPEKCAVCLTCPRVCPHSAIVVEKYAEKNIYVTKGYEKDFQWKAARILPAQCYACGICVSSCPTKAITLKHLTDAEITQQIGV